MTDRDLRSLDPFFRPRSVAVVGASNDPLKAGRQITQNIVEMGFPGEIYPVNPKETEILGMPCHPSLTAIPGPVELVVLIIPSGAIYAMMAEIEERVQAHGDVKAIVCAAAGFAEIGTEEGRERQQFLVETARRLGIRVLGPNCVGLIDNLNRLDTTFVETGLPPETKGKAGGISFLSQSGAIAVSILMWGASQPVPIAFNKFITIGNMADVDVLDMLEYLEADPSTRVIGMYLEGHPQARELMLLLGRIARKKPVVVLKVGRTELGATAAHSHTGSLAGADRIYDAAFRQYGVIRVSTLEEMMDTMQALDRLPLPAGNNLFLVTQAGGPGIFCTDTLSDYQNLRFANISEAAKQELTEMLPPFAAICKPDGYVDITASANMQQHARAVELVLEQPEVDGLILITVPPMFLPPLQLAEELKAAWIRVQGKESKPFLPVIMAGNWVRGARAILENAGLPTFETPDRAARALANMVTYAEFLRRRQPPGLTAAGERAGDSRGE